MIPNPHLIPVPEDQSLVILMDREWQRLQRALYDDHPYEAIIRGIEEAIATRRLQIEGRVLDPTFDWTYDLDRAVFNHQFNLTWINQHRKIRQNYIDYRRSVTEKNTGYLREIALNGMKSMLLIHGGVAVGAPSVLTQQTGGSQVVLTAKFALGFALLGMIWLGLGQLIMVNRMLSINSRLEGKLASTLTWKKVAAFPHYFTRYARPIRYSDWMIYGSIFWFGAYSIILYLMLLAV